MNLRTALSVSVVREKGHVYICLLICDHVSNVDPLMCRMNGVHHYGCLGHHYDYRRMEKRPGASLTSHLEQVEAFIHRRVEEILNNCLRFRSNQALSFLLTPLR